MVEVQDSKLLPIVKVGSIVEDATRMGNRSGKSMEEERREAEEKVNRSHFLEIFSSNQYQVRRYAKEGKGRQLSWKSKSKK